MEKCPYLVFAVPGEIPPAVCRRGNIIQITNNGVLRAPANCVDVVQGFADRNCNRLLPVPQIPESVLKQAPEQGII